MGSRTQQRLQTSCAFGRIKFALLSLVILVLFQGVLCEVEPTESQCRTYIEKALKEHHLDADEKILEDAATAQLHNEEEENFPTDEFTGSTEGSVTKDEVSDDEDEANVQKEGGDDDDDDDDDVKEQNDDEEAKTDDKNDTEEEKDGEEGIEDTEDEKEDKTERDEGDESIDIKGNEEKEDDDAYDQDTISEEPIDIEVQEIELNDSDNDQDDEKITTEDKQTEEDDESKTGTDNEEIDKAVDKEEQDDKDKDEETIENLIIKDEKEKSEEENDENEQEEEKDKDEDETDRKDEKEEEDKEEVKEKEEKEEEKEEEDKEEEKEEDDKEEEKEKEEKEEENEKEEEEKEKEEEKLLKREVRDLGSEYAAEKRAEEEEEEEKGDHSAEEKGEEAPEEELIKEVEIPDNLRPRSHISKILKLDDSNAEKILEKTIDATLKTLKGLYDNAIKPLEMLYKYRDLSNRHFGDPEIFSKPLILFMGPWSGGKSSTINYLLDNEFSHTSLRTGAEPSPAYFNILMYGEEEEILDGTQLAADWTFSGLQKFGQGLLDRLRGIKLPNKLLEKVNIVEIPGILEIRKQVQRMFPFNDACQWFIDRADIIFLVYDPSKLDVGPETEAILDQLKGREYQTRIILNKADQVKPEELMRVQGTLIWNISPLMSSSEPPIMYSTSLWSLPYETGAPIRLLQAQERAFLKDLREAIDKRVENKISSARRFAVRVRNHAKMVDCYLTTYYNHKTIFGNRKKISDDIIEFPQKYHIYEGLSTLTNISRYDLPDPDVYRDFFKINPLYDFKKLSETCTYFRGCPINKLDVAIAYDLPELVGKYKKAVEGAKEELQKKNS